MGSGAEIDRRIGRRNLVRSNKTFYSQKLDYASVSLVLVTKKKLHKIDNTWHSGPNNLERYIPLSWKGLPGTNTLAFWAPP